MKRFLLTMMVLLMAIPSLGATIAWWNFEDGVAGQPFTPAGQPNGSGGSYDIVNNYLMRGWDAYYGPSFTDETPTGEGLAMRNADNHQDGYTDASDALVLNTWSPQQWTIEVSFRLDGFAAGNWWTLIGRDGQSLRGGTRIDNDATFYIQKNGLGGNHIRLNYAPVEGARYLLDSDLIVESGRWYHLAVVSTGTQIRMYADSLDGKGYQSIGVFDLRPATNNALMVPEGGSGGNWTFGRGWWNGGFVDHINGYMDDIRFSDRALDPIEFIHAPLGYAFDPTPANGQTNYGQRVGDRVSAVLKWHTGRDPENRDLVWDQILVHYLYMSKNQNDEQITDANLYYVDTIPAVEDPVEYVVDDLDFDGWYLWRVEEGINDGTSQPYPPGEPNNFAGPIWEFGSRLSVPVVVEHPKDVLADVGQTVEFTVGIESISQEKYQWFKAAGRERDEENDIPITEMDEANAVLTLTDVQVDDEGYYYCKVANEAGLERAVLTNMARLGIRRMVAHWTMDEQDYDPVEGVYLDLSGEGHHAEPNGLPSFAEGQLGDAVEILRQAGFPPTTESWARAGTWDASEFSNQLTVSFWLKWAGTNGTWQGFIAKRSMEDWSNDTVRWQVSTANNLPHLWLESPRGQIAVNNGLVADQWQYIVATFDGTTGALYIDGELRASGNFQLGDAMDVMLCLGGNGFESTGREWMNGVLDDVRIYNYALGELDIAVNYTTDAPDKTACVQSQRPDAQFDLNGNCIVDLGDIAIFAADWLACGIVPDCLP